jgi:hypothetical protein
MRNLKHIFLQLFITSGIVLISCARIGTPTGGDKDTIPPRLIETEPPNFQTNYQGKRVELTFHEFISLEDINSELVVSPPVKERVLTQNKGKSLEVNLNNDLKDSTTYTLSFGNSIVDFHESNPYEDLVFVFSTGPVIDSFEVTGKLLNAFDHTVSEETFFIYLYTNTHDSVPRTTIPSYQGKPNDQGKYYISNIPPTTYKVFALRDMNNNMLFDLPNEQIAFLDSVIHLTPENFIKEEIDTLPTQPADTMYMATDTTSVEDSVFVAADSLQHSEDTALVSEVTYGMLVPTLYFFEENRPSQYITDEKRERRENLKIYFNEPIRDSVELNPLNFTAEDWFLKEWNKRKDSVTYWLTDTSLINKDTLIVEVSFMATDSLENYYNRTDTLKFRFKDKEKTSRLGRRLRRDEETDETGEKIKPLNLSLNVKKNGLLELNQHIRFQSETPVDTIDVSRFYLYRKEDTLWIDEDFVLEKDSLKSRTYSLRNEWLPNLEYKLIVDSLAFTDIYNRPNDSLGINFTSRKDDYYGTFSIDMQNVYEHLIVQLFKEETLVSEKFIDTSQIVQFTYLHPGEYYLKAIFDRNSNNKWDTGDYEEKRQPERVIFLNKNLEAKSNWEVEYTWDVLDDRKNGRIKKKKE